MTIVLPTVAHRASASADSITPASLNLNSIFKLILPSTRIALAEWSSTASHRTPWLGCRAVGSPTASAKNAATLPWQCLRVRDEERAPAGGVVPTNPRKIV